MSASAWPYLLQPKPEELLSSWLVRNSFAHGSNPYRFCHFAFGGGRAWYQDIDRSIQPKYLAEISRLTDISTDQLKNMMLNSFERRITTKTQAITPFLLPVGAYHTSRKRYGQQYCALCLFEDPYYKKRWRLGFYVYCTIHNCEMLDECSHCKAPIVFNRSYPNRLNHCHCCGLALFTNDKPSISPSQNSYTLQTLMLASIQSKQQTLPFGCNNTGELFTMLRIILALLVSKQYAGRIYEYLGKEYTPAIHGQFEFNRICSRIEQLTLLASITADWPEKFNELTKEIGVSKRFFSRMRVPSALQHHIDDLPPSYRHNNKNKDKQLFASIQKYKRRKPDQYRRLRAKILWEKIGGSND